VARLAGRPTDVGGYRRKKFAKSLEDLLRLFLVDPMAAVLDDDAGHVGGRKRRTWLATRVAEGAPARRPRAPAWAAWS